MKGLLPSARFITAVRLLSLVPAEDSDTPRVSRSVAHRGLRSPSESPVPVSPTCETAALLLHVSTAREPPFPPPPQPPRHPLCHFVFGRFVAFFLPKSCCERTFANKCSCLPPTEGNDIRAATLPGTAVPTSADATLMFVILRSRHFCTSRAAGGKPFPALLSRYSFCLRYLL